MVNSAIWVSSYYGGAESLELIQVVYDQSLSEVQSNYLCNAFNFRIVLRLVTLDQRRESSEDFYNKLWYDFHVSCENLNNRLLKELS